jgi:hypothetical protein
LARTEIERFFNCHSFRSFSDFFAGARRQRISFDAVALELGASIGENKPLSPATRREHLRREGIHDGNAAGIELFMLQFQPFEAEMRRFALEVTPRGAAGADGYRCADARTGCGWSGRQLQRDGWKCHTTSRYGRGRSGWTTASPVTIPFWVRQFVRHLLNA